MCWEKVREGGEEEEVTCCRRASSNQKQSVQWTHTRSDTCTCCVILTHFKNCVQYYNIQWGTFEGFKFCGLWVGFLASFLLTAASQSFLPHKFPIIIV